MLDYWAFRPAVPDAPDAGGVMAAPWRPEFGADEDQCLLIAVAPPSTFQGFGRSKIHMAQTPIIIYGVGGRMGRAVLAGACSPEAGFDVVAATEAPGSSLVGQALRLVDPEAPESVEVSDQLPAEAPSGAVVINFTLPAPTMAQLEWAAGAGVASVVGTTGFDEAQLAQIREFASRVPILLAPNMSVGVNVLYRLVDQAIRLLGPDYDIEITEMHHRFKKDAPSGTARRLLEVAVEASRHDKIEVRHGREGITGERSAAEIGMHCLRGGDVVGDHTVTLATLGERVELTHKAGSRDTFARGALRAATWISGKAPRLYAMNDVLGL